MSNFESQPKSTSRKEYEDADAALVARNVRYAEESDRNNPAFKLNEPNFVPTAEAKKLSQEHFADQKEILGQRADIVSRANEEAIAEDKARKMAEGAKKYAVGQPKSTIMDNEKIADLSIEDGGPEKLYPLPEDKKDDEEEDDSPTETMLA